MIGHVCGSATNAHVVLFSFECLESFIFLFAASCISICAHFSMCMTIITLRCRLACGHESCRQVRESTTFPWPQQLFLTNFSASAPFVSTRSPVQLQFTCVRMMMVMMMMVVVMMMMKSARVTSIPFLIRWPRTSTGNVISF